MRGLRGDPTDPAHSSQDWKELGGCFRLKEERGMTITVKSQRFIPGPAVILRKGQALELGNCWHQAAIFTDKTQSGRGLQDPFLLY